MSRVDELERAMLEGARRQLAPSASDRMRVQTLLLGNEAWFQPAPARRPSLRSFARSWRGGAALGFALGALLGFGGSQVLGLLSGPQVPAAAAGEPALEAPVSSPLAAPAPAEPPPARSELAAPSAESASEEAVRVERPQARREAPPRGRRSVAEQERSTLAQELALLQRARRALNREDGRLALGIVESLDERFPDGVLMEEREATRILSLCQLQRTDEARAQGQQFLAEHPRSVYAERVRRSCAGRQ